MLEALWAPDTTPKQGKAAGWKRVGELPDGRPIWEETVTVVTGKQPLKVNGVQQYVKVNGEIVKERMVNVTKQVTRQFVEEKQPNGGKFKNYYFRPDPAELERVARQNKIADVQKRLAEGLVDRGLGVDDLLNALGSSEDTDTTDTPRRRRRAA